MENTQKLIKFIEKSVSPYHAVKNISDKLAENGFTELSECDAWDIRRGGKYFVTRNSSSIIAFTVPENGLQSFFIAASHTDSPAFKLKDNFELEACKAVKLSVEGYGGMIMHTWLDRPLSVCGRVIAGENGKLVTRLVNIDRDLVIIPNLAIHLCRDANKGYEWNIKRDMCPIAGTRTGAVMAMAAECAGVSEADILDFDLSLYCRDRGAVFGTDNEYFAAPRIDDLQCVFASLEGFLSAPESDAVQVFAAFDNEEVGSGTRQGAKSSFLYDTLTRINGCLGGDEASYIRAAAKSFMLSCDNAHAIHPNYPDKYDELNRVYMNGGIVIKYNANARYTTDAVTGAAVKLLCKRADVPYQIYANRSDILGGSTLGNLSAEKVSVRTADIGLAQLAMHSAYETAGSGDTTYMIRLIREFYKGEIEF